MYLERAHPAFLTTLVVLVLDGSPNLLIQISCKQQLLLCSNYIVVLVFNSNTQLYFQERNLLHVIPVEESLPGQTRKRGTPKFMRNHDPRKLHQLPHPVIPRDDVPAHDADHCLLLCLCVNREQIQRLYTCQVI